MYINLRSLLNIWYFLLDNEDSLHLSCSCIADNPVYIRIYSCSASSSWVYMCNLVPRSLQNVQE